ncbi:hypothetical protein PZB77_21000 [Streptomyces sp. AM 2-1-1]|nr:hypothetical protein [Streptomyces sp. AM 2-1-1]WEH41772.1 hypothetical protein PZB77_21000 [Streptomyces sp. AM 2-1-1]
MTEQNELRLVPWSSPEGKPCYLSTDDSDSHMSRLADDVEANQLDWSARLLKSAFDPVVGNGSLDDLRLLVKELSGALRDVLRVAVGRGPSGGE